LIKAFDFKKLRASNKKFELWKTTITSRGSSDDLRQVFPVLIGAAVPHLGKNTGKKVPVQLSESDEIIKAVKGELAKEKVEPSK